MHTAIGSSRIGPGVHTAIRSWPNKIGEADWRSRLAMKIGEEGSKEEGGRKEEEEEEAEEEEEEEQL